ncbi:hypothetical protein BH11BAC2_BH11BAC2_01240 [soil metagenome]
MKIKLPLLSLIIMIGIISGLTSCSDAGGGGTPSGVMIAQVDGVGFSASDSAGGTITAGFLNVTGVASNGRTISITILSDQKGTYDLGPAGLGAATYQVSPTASVTYTSNASILTGGTVTISKIDLAARKISGSFHFTAANASSNAVIDITNGEFNDLRLSTTAVTPASDSLSATIDGVPFQGVLVSGVESLGMISLVGSAASGYPSLGITIPDTTSVGTYAIDGISYFGQYNTNATTFLSADSGSITISLHDKVAKRIEGTFNFVATDFGQTLSDTITNGKFKITYN